MYTHTYTFINMYFDIYFFLCLSIRSVLISGFSKSCCSPAEVDVRTLSGGIFWSIHDKSIHRTLLRLTQIPWQWDKVPSGKRLSPGAFRQIWSPTVREKGKEWFRIPPRLGLEMRERSQGCTQTCHTADLTNRNYAETSKMDLSQPPDPDI